MSTYAEMDRLRKLARPLYLELRALGLNLIAHEDPDTPSGYWIDLVGRKYLSPVPRRLPGRACRGGDAGAAEGSVGPVGRGPRGCSGRGDAVNQYPHLLGIARFGGACPRIRGGASLLPWAITGDREIGRSLFLPYTSNNCLQVQRKGVLSMDLFDVEVSAMLASVGTSDNVVSPSAPSRSAIEQAKGRGSSYASCSGITGTGGEGSP